MEAHKKLTTSLLIKLRIADGRKTFFMFKIKNEMKVSQSESTSDFMWLIISRKHGTGETLRRSNESWCVKVHGKFVKVLVVFNFARFFPNQWCSACAFRHPADCVVSKYFGFVRVSLLICLRLSSFTFKEFRFYVGGLRDQWNVRTVFVLRLRFCPKIIADAGSNKLNCLTNKAPS